MGNIKEKEDFWWVSFQAIYFLGVVLILQDLYLGLAIWLLPTSPQLHHIYT